MPKRRRNFSLRASINPLKGFRALSPLILASPVKNNLVFFSLFFPSLLTFAQCPSPDPMLPYIKQPASNSNCSPLPKNGFLPLQTSPNVDFTFDQIRDYNAGITLSGSTILHLKVDSGTALCKWKLLMYIDNNGAPTPVNEWETLATYGIPGAVKPKIDLLQVKVYNGCATPICEQWQTFIPQDDAAIDIIYSPLPVIPAGSCTENVDGLGSYLNHYNEYTFTVDYRIKPGFVYAAGVYQLGLHFYIVEDD